jgi:hypothetical protein
LRASRYQGLWRKRPTGPLTLKQALAFVRSRGVTVPRYLLWCVAEHEGLSLQECGLAGADATYYRTDEQVTNADFRIDWSDLERKGRIPVWIRAEVLESEDHVLYVFSHEIYEIKQLKRVFLQNKGSLSLRRLSYLIDPENDGAIHADAVNYSDDLVEKLWRQWDVDHGHQENE